jgi:hypothetical protein
MMTAEKKHRCGGTLVAHEVQIVLDENAAISFGYIVHGFICNKCGERLIDRETAFELQASQTPTIAWHSGKGVSSTRLDAIRFDPLTAATPQEALV